ncbi:rhodanese-related sulfurtransferase [Halarchaeum rubridurum]|uniref:Rhodanese-related sulfurtransferase n=1 Tax=Halarchaeum rubridurum TaxID=489911 RepID=A0A830FXM7_9EURY|nr:rhodanese-like domain-containing protein [Halarchaeum rubridurum]MBP1953840.1 rhodanese-related sulfurtransferase [Halarchaeum rubridurum]GGM55218.1 hypothetical protein GCM10009017_01800 [Halarchaeum rubridurum]
MDRRDYLAALGVAGLAGLAGCGALSGRDGLGDGPPAGCGVPESFAANRGALPPDETPTDGIPPALDGDPPSHDLDPDVFPVATVAGVDVRLVPVDAAHYWWRRGAARFADARGRDAYDRAHVYGAVWSPADGTTDPANGSDGSDESDESDTNDACDPVDYWPEGDRIVCYGGETDRHGRERAAALVAADYDEVYAVREGFPAWRRAGYPSAGRDVEPTGTTG